jgi:hypothetical protein
VLGKIGGLVEVIKSSAVTLVVDMKRIRNDAGNDIQ